MWCAGDLDQLREAEREKGIEPDPQLAAFMKANTLEGKRESVHTEFIMRTLGLTVCADTMVWHDYCPIYVLMSHYKSAF